MAAAIDPLEAEFLKFLTEVRKLPARWSTRKMAEPDDKDKEVIDHLRQMYMSFHREENANLMDTIEELRTVKLEKERLAAQLQVSEEKVAQLAEQNVILSNSNNTLTTDLADTSAQLDNIKVKLTKAKAKVSRLKKEKSDHGGEIDKLKEKVVKLEKRKSTLKAKVIQLSDENTNLLIANGTLTAKFDQLQIDLDAEQAKLVDLTTEKSILGVEVEDLKAKLATFKVEKLTLSAEKESMKVHFDDELKSYRQRNAVWHLEEIRLNRNLAAAKAEITGLEADVTTLTKYKTRLEEAITAGQLKFVELRKKRVQSRSSKIQSSTVTETKEPTHPTDNRPTKGKSVVSGIAKKLRKSVKRLRKKLGTRHMQLHTSNM